MKETRFISQNKEKWLESEALLRDERKDPGKLSNLFTQVVDDLSFSRTYYPNRSVRVYLNKIAREYFSIIYNSQKEKKGGFRMFWIDELPQVIIHCRTQLLISLAVFLFAMAIGIFSSFKDPQFAASILGPSYVAMTKENIEKGDPMAVYKKGHQVDMFLGITLNNLMVAFRTYIFGIFLSVGTLAILLFNGIMVGCFQFFFIERGLFVESALSIWLHGTLEISSIILAGGAGLTLGSGLAFPGTYSRFQAFQISAIRSLKLMLGITPVLVVAAIIESFLTRYTEVPDFVKLLLIILSAIFIIGYFVIYPWLKSRSGFEVPISEARLQPTPYEPPDLNQIKNNADILKDTFLFYKNYFSKIFPWIAAIALLVTTADLLVGERSGELRYNPEWWDSFFGGLFYAMKTPDLLFVLINTLGTTIIVYRVLILMDKNTKGVKTVSGITFAQILIVISLVYFAILGLDGWGVFLVILSFVFFLLMVFVQVTERHNLFKSFTRSWSLLTANFGQVVGLQFTLLLMCTSFLLILSAPLIYLYTTIFKWNFAPTDVWSGRIVHFIELYIKTLAFDMILPILAVSAAYLYFSLNELLSADHLLRSIALVRSKYSKKNSH